ncbi:MAG: S41 family peptidase [Gammaproteobacteria bacterium]
MRTLARPLLAAAALFACSQGALGQADARRLTDAQWRADLDEVVQLLEHHHPNPYHEVGRERFAKARRDLDQAIPGLDDGQIAARLMQLVGSLRDGHTVLLPNDPAGFNRWLPLSFYWFSDGLHVTAADADYAGLVGARIEAFGDTPAPVAHERTADLLGSDNDSGRRWSTFYLASVDALLATGVVARGDRVAIRAKLPDGKSARVEVAPVTLPFTLEHRFWGEMHPPGARERADRYRMPVGSLSLSQWRALGDDARAALPLHLRSRMAYWYAVLPEQKTLYLHMTHVTEDGRGGFASFRQFYEHVFERFEREDLQTFVLDLRYNSGGDGSVLIPFVHGFIRSDKLRQPGRLYTLTGRKTYSAGVMLVDLMLKHTSTVLVGEPSGAPRSSYGDAGSHRLPNSGMQLDVSTVHWQLVSSADRSREHAVDIPAPFSGADYFGGRDPAMDFILSRTRPWQPLPDLFRQAGGTAAKREYAQRKKQWGGYPWWFAFDESDLRSAARDAARDGRRADAEAGFGILLDRHPDSWRAWRDYGDALRAWGEKRRARECYERGLRLNPGYEGFRERMAELAG